MHISPTFFYTYKNLKSGQNDTHQIHSSNKLANYLLSHMPTTIF